MKFFKFAALIIAAIFSCSFTTNSGDDKDEPKPETTIPGSSNIGGKPQQGSEVSILGTWSGAMTYKDKDGTFQGYIEWTFSSDNTCAIKMSAYGYSDTMYGTYTVYGNLASGATLEVSYTTPDRQPYTEPCRIRINGNTAVITDEDGVSVTLTRR